MAPGSLKKFTNLLKCLHSNHRSPAPQLFLHKRGETDKATCNVSVVSWENLIEHGGADSGCFVKNIRDNGFDVIGKVNSCHFYSTPGSLLTSGFAQVVSVSYLRVRRGAAGYVQVMTKNTQMRSSVAIISFPESQERLRGHAFGCIIFVHRRKIVSRCIDVIFIIEC